MRIAKPRHPIPYPISPEIPIQKPEKRTRITDQKTKKKSAPGNSRYLIKMILPLDVRSIFPVKRGIKVFALWMILEILNPEGLIFP